MPGSTEAQVARLDERLNAISESLSAIVSEMKEAAASRKHNYQVQEGMARDLIHITHRLENVEKEVSAIRPTNEEYLQYRERVRGAGILGIGLWKLGGVILAAAGWLYSVYLIITGRPPP